MTSGKKRRILIIDDDDVFTRILHLSLRNRGYDVYCINSSKQAVELISKPLDVDLFILDFHLDDVSEDGLSLCRKIKANFSKPIIMLTGESTTDAKVSCLYAGADQYVVKPYVFEELLAVIHVALERYPAESDDHGRVGPGSGYSDLVIDSRTRKLVAGDRWVKLTEREQQLIEVLIANPEKYLPRDQIYLRIFGFQMPPFNRAIDILVGRLRKKLERIVDDLAIQSSRNEGYGLFDLKSTPSQIQSTGLN